MGFMDHKRSWEFRVRANPDQCVNAFASAMNGGSKLSPMSSKWDIRATKDGAAAVYQGRGGLGDLLTTATQRGTDERNSAIGSTVKFRTSAGDDGSTVCHMHLAEFTTAIGFTSDARFMRAAMQRVEGALRAIDPSVTVLKS